MDSKERRRLKHQAWYAANRENLIIRRRAAYAAKQPVVSGELLLHLRDYPTHALGVNEDVCIECARLGPFDPVVCLICGRQRLDQAATHVGKQHRLSWRSYQDQFGLARKRSGASPRLREAQSRRSKSPAMIASLNEHGFDSETAKQINRNRKFALRERRRTSKQSEPRRTSLSRRLQPVSGLDWSIASQRLTGIPSRYIAAKLHVSESLINARCRAWGLPPKAACFWRGEAIGDRHLQLLLRESNSTLKALGAQIDVRPYRLRAARRRDEAFPADIGRKIVEQLIGLEKRRPVRQRLLAYQKTELRWKAESLRRDLETLRAELRERIEKQAPASIEGLLCHLMRRKKIALLFRWGREFVEWTTGQEGRRRLNTALLLKNMSRIADETYNFLANEYGVSPETVRRALREDNVEQPPVDARERGMMVDLLNVLDRQEWTASTELLAALKASGLMPWAQMHSTKALASILKPLGLRPRNRRDGSHVLKGYRRCDLRFYTTAEAARKLQVSRITLKKYISRGTIPVPPLVRRRGVRGRGRIRVWTESDLSAAVEALLARPAKYRRPR